MERKAKNILLIIPELSIGGAQRSLANLSLELAKFHAVHIAIFSKSDLASYQLGGEVTSLEVYPKGNWFSKIQSFFLRVVRLRTLKKKLQIDVSISFLEGADYVNILSKRKEKVFISIRGSKFADQQIAGFLGVVRLRILMPVLYRMADKIICVSEALKDEMTGKMNLRKDSVITIYNFYDFESLIHANHSPANQEFNAFIGTKYIVSVGRLHPQKNFSKLIDVFYESGVKKNEYKLVIVGDGAEKEFLIGHCLTLGLRVFILGKTPFSLDYDIFLMGFQNPYFFLKNAELFLLTSLWEGFPNVLLEAMATETTVLAADCPTGPREIIAPDAELNAQLNEPVFASYGILMPILNSQLAVSIWSATLRSLLSDSEALKSYGKKGLQRVQAFEKELALDRWNQCIDEQFKV